MSLPLMPLAVINSQHLLAWCAVTALLAFTSRRSLGNPHCHGFYRFFVFSLCAAVAIPNLSLWTKDLFAAHQLVSWLLLFSALAFVLSGLFLLKTQGGQRNDGPTENFAFENTDQLVVNGIFGLVRHPMYSALILLTWGVWFKQFSWLGLTLCVATTLLIWITAKIEEGENLNFFGPDYQAYMQRTKRFIPYVF